MPTAWKVLDYSNNLSQMADGVKENLKKCNVHPKIYLKRGGGYTKEGEFSETDRPILQKTDEKL